MTTENEWIKLSDKLNTMMGEPTCPTPCEHGGRCSLDNPHEGDHIAMGSRGELCRWEQKDG